MDFPNTFPVQPNMQFQRTIIVPRIIFDTLHNPQLAARIAEMREFLLGIRTIAPSPYDELPGIWPDLDTFTRWLLRGTSDIQAAYCALYQIRHYANIDIHGHLRNMIGRSLEVMICLFGLMQQYLLTKKEITDDLLSKGKKFEIVIRQSA